MTEIKQGDTVRIHYKGTLLDGNVFDSSEGRDPLEFVVGSGQIIPGLDTAMPGLTVGREKAGRDRLCGCLRPDQPGDAAGHSARRYSG